MLGLDDVLKVEELVGGLLHLLGLVVILQEVSWQEGIPLVRVILNELNEGLEGIVGEALILHDVNRAQVLSVLETHDVRLVQDRLDYRNALWC